MSVWVSFFSIFLFVLCMCCGCYYPFLLVCKLFVGPATHAKSIVRRFSAGASKVFTSQVPMFFRVFRWSTLYSIQIWQTGFGSLRDIIPFLWSPPPPTRSLYKSHCFSEFLLVIISASVPLLFLPMFTGFLLLIRVWALIL